AQSSSSTLRTCPRPSGGGPKPTLDTYRLPSGPSVIPVGEKRPSAITLRELPLLSTRTIRPVPGVGAGAADASRTYIRFHRSNARPSTRLNPEVSSLMLPLGVTFQTFELPVSWGKTPRLPT